MVEPGSHLLLQLRAEDSADGVVASAADSSRSSSPADRDASAATEPAGGAADAEPDPCEQHLHAPAAEVSSSISSEGGEDVGEQQTERQHSDRVVRPSQPAKPRSQWCRSTSTSSAAGRQGTTNGGTSSRPSSAGGAGSNISCRHSSATEGRPVMRRGSSTAGAAASVNGEAPRVSAAAARAAQDPSRQPPLLPRGRGKTTLQKGDALAAGAHAAYDFGVAAAVPRRRSMKCLPARVHAIADRPAWGHSLYEFRMVCKAQHAACYPAHNCLVNLPCSFVPAGSAAPAWHAPTQQEVQLLLQQVVHLQDLVDAQQHQAAEKEQQHVAAMAAMHEAHLSAVEALQGRITTLELAVRQLQMQHEATTAAAAVCVVPLQSPRPSSTALGTSSSRNSSIRAGPAAAPVSTPGVLAAAAAAAAAVGPSSDGGGSAAAPQPELPERGGGGGGRLSRSTSFSRLCR